MHGLASDLLLVAGALAVAGAARRRETSAPLLLVLAGLAASYIPGVPDYDLDPDVVLLIFLPPLLFSAALDSSYLDIRRNLRSISLLSVGLVLFTALAVALTAYALVPGLGMAAAFTLGAIVAPPDAVAATAIGRSVGLPRRMLVVLAGESLLNDATALTAYRVAVSAVVTGGFSLAAGAGIFAYAAVVGLAAGVALAMVVDWLNRHLSDPVLESTLLLLTPFVAYLLMEQIDASGVLAVVAAGLYLGHRSRRSSTYAGRLTTDTVWGVMTFVLETLVFALIGLQLPGVLDGVSNRSAWQLAGVTLAVFAVILLARAAWIFTATYLPLLFSRSDADRAGIPWQLPAVLSWAGMRGVVSLAAAFAVPALTDDGAPFPERDLILFLTFGVVIGTLVLHGYTLPAMIRWLGVINPEEARRDNLSEAAAQQAAGRAALARLDELLDEEAGHVPEDVVQRLRDKAMARSLRAWERLGGDPGRGFTETPTASYRRLRLEMLEAERSVFYQLRDTGRLDDEVLRRVIRELDFEEATLARD